MSVMDPITQALTLATAVTHVYLQMLEAASPAQKQELVALWIEDLKFWRGLADRLVPKG